jgi:PAS domain S-box-containing protein
VVGQIAEPGNVRTGPTRVPVLAGSPVEPPTFDPTLLGRIVDVVADGITVQAPDGRVVLANALAARIAGFTTPDELIGASSDSLRDRFELFDENHRPVAWQDLPGARVLRDGQPSSRIIGLRNRETGRERWSAVSSSAIRDASGAVAYAVNAFHDVTDNRRAEEDLRRQQGESERLLTMRLGDEVRLAELVTSERARSAELHAIIGAIGEGIVVIDAAGTVSLVNRTAERLLGSRDALATDGPLERLALPDGMDLPALVAHGPLQARLHGSAGGWLEVAAYPVAGADPGSGSTILILRDVTEAREREQARDAFIGVLSHELRTPVTTIYAGAKVLARSKTTLDEEARIGIFEDIHTEAERLHRLVEDVVALTRFGEGALEIGNEPVLLQRVLPAVARSEQGRWPGGRFELELTQDLPPVAGEATYVEQVVRNLLANAMKYAGTDATVRIRATVATSGSEVEVRVLDGGPGFPESEAGRLFELYYRSPTVARKVSGSGIGLFVCARLIDAMGGHIWAVNRGEHGAEFGFALRVMSGDR